MVDSFGFRGNQPINSALFNTRHNNPFPEVMCGLNSQSLMLSAGLSQVGDGLVCDLG
jgi:hypothetical protein